jgi:hypothetical protein
MDAPRAVARGSGGSSVASSKNGSRRTRKVSGLGSNPRDLTSHPRRSLLGAHLAQASQTLPD